MGDAATHTKHLAATIERYVMENPEAPCADCGRWMPVRELVHCAGDSGCEQCPDCADKYIKKT